MNQEEDEYEHFARCLYNESLLRSLGLPSAQSHDPSRTIDEKHISTLQLPALQSLDPNEILILTSAVTLMMTDEMNDLMRKRLRKDYPLFVRTRQNFMTYVSIFGFTILETHGDVYDSLLIMTAAILQIVQFCDQRGHKEFVEVAHICWSSIFRFYYKSAFIKGGGWEEFLSKVEEWEDLLTGTSDSDSDIEVYSHALGDNLEMNLTRDFFSILEPAMDKLDEEMLETQLTTQEIGEESCPGAAYQIDRLSDVFVSLKVSENAPVKQQSPKRPLLRDTSSSLDDLKNISLSTENDPLISLLPTEDTKLQPPRPIVLGASGEANEAVLRSPFTGDKDSTTGICRPQSPLMDLGWSRESAYEEPHLPELDTGVPDVGNIHHEGIPHIANVPKSEFTQHEPEYDEPTLPQSVTETGAKAIIQQADVPYTFSAPQSEHTGGARRKVPVPSSAQRSSKKSKKRSKKQAGRKEGTLTLKIDLPAISPPVKSDSDMVDDYIELAFQAHLVRKTQREGNMGVFDPDHPTVKNTGTSKSGKIPLKYAAASKSETTPIKKADSSKSGKSPAKHSVLSKNAEVLVKSSTSPKGGGARINKSEDSSEGEEIHSKSVVEQHKKKDHKRK